MAVSLDEVVALNEEISALVRAQVPLGDGLISVGYDLPGRLGKITQELGERIKSGQTLEQAVAALGDSIPPVYRAVITAGIKSGRLSTALESLARSAKLMSEMRRVVTLASIYPLIVVAIACELFGFVAWRIIPSFQHLVDFSSSRGYQTLLSLKGELAQWIGLAPVALFAVLFVLWLRAGMASRLGMRSSDTRWTFLPSIKRIIATARAASFSEMLGILIEHGVPLHEALAMASEATGDRRVAAAGRELAGHLEIGGEANPEALPAASALPPRVMGHLIGKRDSHQLGRVLQSLATMYHRRALRESDWLRMALPILLTIFIAGTVTLLYVLAVFWPFTEMLKKVSDYQFMGS